MSPWSTPDDRLDLCVACRYWKASDGLVCNECGADRTAIIDRIGRETEERYRAVLDALADL